MTTTAALREALNEGISSGKFVDTKIILYSRRDSSGRICKPKPLYASSHVLKTVPYFKDLLFGDFAESQSKGFEDPIDEEECAEDYGYSSDSDLEEEDGERSTSKHTGWLGVSSHACENHKEPVRNGKVVKISDIAFVTFQAVLMYLYTGYVVFAPFGSEDNRRSRKAEMKDPSDSKIPCPSPKSIYRLADKYDIPALRTLALNQIYGGLGKCDIVEQSFSRFASRYDEVKNLYIQKLAFDWSNDSTTEATRTSFKNKISRFVERNPAHTTEVLHALLDAASKSKNPTGPTNPTNTSLTHEATYTLHPTPLRTALVMSIRKSVFFDRKYWARRFKAGDVLTPIYFSSSIMNDNTRRLNKVVNYIDVQNSLPEDFEGDVIFESDCEGDSPRAEKELPRMKESEDPTRPVLTHGSFSAWKSLFFYLCTSKISFAPLKSQGTDYRLDYVREKTVAGAPPPCSPKSIYVLANLLGISHLRENAFSDIKSKVTLDNVVGEVFSWVTAGQEMTKTQCALLVPNLTNPKTLALVKEKVEDISERYPHHCADVLMTVLEGAFELKKQHITAKLRCSGCSSIISYSSLQGRAYPCCYSYYAQCARCGKEKGWNYGSRCGGCGKNFR